MSDTATQMDSQHSPATTATSDRCDTPTSTIDLSGAAASSRDIFGESVQTALDAIWEHRKICQVRYCSNDSGSIHPLTEELSIRAKEALSALKKIEQTRLEKCQTARGVCDAYADMDDDEKRKLASDKSSRESLHMVVTDMKHWGTGHAALYNAYLASTSSANVQLWMEPEACSHFRQELAPPTVVKDTSLYEFCSKVDADLAKMVGELNTMASEGQTGDVDADLAKMVGELSTVHSEDQSEA